jgi:hypothetical protein
VLFESTAVLTVSIAMVYWFLLFPSMYKDFVEDTGMFRGKPKWQAAIELIFTSFDHLHPDAAIMVEWMHNQIRFDPRHYLVSFLLWFTYSTYNFIETERIGSPLYWTNDWINHKMRAFEVTMLCGVLTTASYISWYYLTKSKLARYNKETDNILIIN